MLEKISDKFTDIVRQFSGTSSITEKNIQDAVEEIKIALLEADVNLRVVRRFVNRTIEEAKGEDVLKSVNPGQQFIKIVYDKIVQLLGDERKELLLKGPDTQSVILMMGLQGSGKTTTAAKLAFKLKKEGRRPLLVAADLVRPAAVKQLQILGESIEVPVYAEEVKDPVRVVKNALKLAKREQYDTVIIDTSGRMHLDAVLMQEITQIHKAAQPDETLFVADAMTGQSAVTIAKEFDEQVGITGVILTKFDSDTRGGAALSIRSITGKPIKYIGVGEKTGDLDPFFPERIASRILGMGDVVSLVEKAQETIDIKEAEKLQKKMSSSTFDLQDYLEQIERMDKMGPMESIIDMIPGAKGNISEDDINKAEIKREKAIIQSMTFEERRNYRIVGPSRRKRIAKGSGTAVYDVNRMLKKFEKMRLMMKKVSKNKRYQAQMLKQMGM
ncbi:MAG: signal recognition particle protein [Spirochaetia bacterium]|nr:signal recognition particle protein [Spirochaetia bacterium]MCF7940169.1 signal recognition particle protein [Spirochaetia bacterium]